MAVWLARTLFCWCDSSFLYILTVLWDTKHIKQSLIKQSLIIWVDAAKQVSCVFNAKGCLSSACTMCFYNLIICLVSWHTEDLRWVPDETFLCSCLTTHVPQPWTRREVQSVQPSDVTEDTAVVCLTQSCDTGKSSDPSPRKTRDNHKVRQEWYCMVNPDLCLSENLSWLFMCKTL